MTKRGGCVTYIEAVNKLECSMCPDFLLVVLGETLNNLLCVHSVAVQKHDVLISVEYCMMSEKSPKNVKSLLGIKLRI